MTTSPYALSPGTYLEGSNGIYRIDQVVGQGGFGITYSAALMMNGVAVGSVIVKEFYPEAYASRDADGMTVCTQDRRNYKVYYDKFTEEAQNLASINHKNVINVLDGFYSWNTAYYVMPYIKGGSLKHAVAWMKAEGVRVTQDGVLTLLRNILGALEYMHQAGVYHLDLKPDNILLQKTEDELRPVLIDVGSARMGSPAYMPHEQISDDEEIGPWTDLYSLAVSFHLLLTGKLPPAHIQEQKALKKAPQRKLLADSKELKEIYHTSLLASIDRCLAWKTEKRFRSATDWLKYLERIPEEVSTTDGLVSAMELVDENGEPRQIKKRPNYGAWESERLYDELKKVPVCDDYDAKLQELKKRSDAGPYLSLLFPESASAPVAASTSP